MSPTKNPNQQLLDPERASDAAALLPTAAVGVVAIGRNEGERLKRALDSLMMQTPRIVYVDSDSTDDSVTYAKSIGVDVVTLDMSQPFTAARARNAGFERLCELHEGIEYVMFLDGDCEVAEGWLALGEKALVEDSNLGVVYGNRVERFPDASIYNRLCHMEWNPEPGEVPACGGDALFRVQAFEEAGRFNPAMIAGEEPELSVRIRARGWRIECFDVTMTIHDAAMTRFKQWWRRQERCGHAYAEGCSIHGSGRFRHNVEPVRRILFWGLMLPLIMVGILVAGLIEPLLWIGLTVPLALHGVVWWRVYRWRRRRNDAPRHCALYASFTVLGKYPEVCGLLSFWNNRRRGSRRKLIEYK